MTSAGSVAWLAAHSTGALSRPAPIFPILPFRVLSTRSCLPLPLPVACSKGKAAEELRGAPYLLPLEEVGRRTAEARERGATEVCMQVRSFSRLARRH